MPALPVCAAPTECFAVPDREPVAVDDGAFVSPGDSVHVSTGSVVTRGEMSSSVEGHLSNRFARSDVPEVVGRDPSSPALPIQDGHVVNVQPMNF